MVLTDGISSGVARGLTDSCMLQHNLGIQCAIRTGVISGVEESQGHRRGMITFAWYHHPSPNAQISDHH
mgnify:CR=1 FL=1